LELDILHYKIGQGRGGVKHAPQPTQVTQPKDTTIQESSPPVQSQPQSQIQSQPSTTPTQTQTPTTQPPSQGKELTRTTTPNTISESKIPKQEEAKEVTTSTKTLPIQSTTSTTAAPVPTQNALVLYGKHATMPNQYVPSYDVCYPMKKGSDTFLGQTSVGSETGKMESKTTYKEAKAIRYSNRHIFG
jgi:hypothetical protein